MCRECGLRMEVLCWFWGVMLEVMFQDSSLEFDITGLTRPTVCEVGHRIATSQRINRHAHRFQPKIESLYVGRKA
jgi:hypothetical protein